MDVVNHYKYTIRDRIDDDEGQNSIGVFRAFDPQIQTEIAVKEIKKDKFRNTDAYFAEAQAMFRSHHPNVVPINVATQRSDRICLTMPLYKKGSLTKRIKNGPILLADVLRVGREILSGLNAIHKAGTIHFDIKPSNVLFSDRNVAMIADFGQARDVGPNGVTLMPDRMYGPITPPEAFTNARRGTVESDIYQFGLMLYRAANGDPHFDEEWARAANGDPQAKIIAEKFPRRDNFLPHVPDRLKRIIRRALRADPDRRYSSAIAVSNALAKVTPRNDWATRLAADGSIRWVAARRKQSDLSVRLEPVGPGWDVTLHTLSSGKERKCKRGLWKTGLNRQDAFVYLSQLFSALE